MAKRWWYYQDWRTSPRMARNPDDVLEPLLEGTFNERTRYTFFMSGRKWWRGLFTNNTHLVFVRDPRLLIDTRNSQIITPHGEVMEWLRANVRHHATVCIDTAEDRKGHWDTGQNDFAWVEFTNLGEATMFKLVFG